MNWDQVEGRWQQITGNVKSAWGKLTDDDVKNIAGKRDVLIGKIQRLRRQSSPADAANGEPAVGHA
jgi:uncharacterized protein YjbJ (UPF0337 family)